MKLYSWQSKQMEKIRAVAVKVSFHLGLAII